MIRQIIKRLSAKHDLIEIANYLAQFNADTAFRFIDQTEADFRRLAEWPDIGSRFIGKYGFEGIRRWNISGFRRYAIFYRSTEDSIEIIRVLHGSRDVKRIMNKER